MRICIFTTSYPRTADDTAGMFIAAQAEALAARGHAVTVACPATARDRVLQGSTGVTVVRFRYAISGAVELTGEGGIVPSLRRRPWLWLVVPLFFVSAVLTLRREARRADLIHAHWLPGGLIALAASFGRGIPVIVTVHGSDVAPSSGRFIRLVARYVATRVAQVIAVSAQLRREVLELGCPPERVTVIPTPVIDARELLALPIPSTVRHHLLWIGRLIPEKRPLVIPSIMQRLCTEFPDAHVDITGDGPLRAELERRVASMDLAERVTVHGVLARPALRAVMEGADILLNTSRQEGFGLTIVEAMLAGRAVVAASYPALAELVENGVSGIVVEPSSDEIGSFTAAVMRLINDDVLRQRLAKAARVRAGERTTPSSVATQIETVYHDLLVQWPLRYWQERHRKFSDSWRSVGCQRFTEQANSYMYQTVRERYVSVLDALTLPEGAHVLDAGAGTGAYLDLFLRRGWKVTASDVSAEAMTELARRFPEVTTVVAPLSKPVAAARSFELVHCFDVLYHVLDDAEWRASMSTLARQSCQYVILHGLFPKTMPPVRGRHVRQRSARAYADALGQEGFVEVGSYPTHWTAMRFPLYYLQNVMPSWFYRFDRMRNGTGAGRKSSNGHAIKVFCRNGNGA